jgi:DNA-binding NtrC family response regulator
VERAVLLSEGDRIETRYMDGDPPVRADAEEGSSGSVDVNRPFKVARDERADSFARAYWTEMLRQCRGNISEASRRGGLHRKSLEYALKKLDINARDVGVEENQ